MDYNELIERYGRGELDPEQTDMVRRDIQRHAAISSYLAEKDEDIEALFNEASSKENEPEDPREFSKKVRKQIRRSFLKAGLITALAIMAAVLFIIYALPKLIDRANYDPTEIVGVNENGEGIDQMSLDLAVYSELFMPADYRQTVRAVALGSGKYSIYIPRQGSIASRTGDTAGFVDKGRLTLYDPNLLRLPDKNCFHITRAGLHGKTGEVYTVGKPSLEELTGDMDENDTRLVYITFKQPTTLSEALYWCNGYGETRPIWAAVCTGDDVKLPVYYGMHPYPYGFTQGYDEEKYPCLSLPSMQPDEDVWRQHLASLLFYAADHAESMRMFYGEGWDDDTTSVCRESAEYILENGFGIYGVVFTADAKTIESIYIQDDYSAIYLAPLE